MVGKGNTWRLSQLGIKSSLAERQMIRIGLHKRIFTNGCHAHNYFAFAQLAHDYQFKPHKYLGHNDFAHNYFAPDPSTRYFVLFVFKIHFDQLHFVQQYTPGDYKGVEQKARFSRP